MYKVDYALMYVTDDSITDDTAFFKILEDALKGGTSIIQLREKSCNTLSFYNRALKTKYLCRAYGVPLIINDRIDIALAVDAAGVHIGQTDMPYSKARALLGATKIIGLSISNTEQAIGAENLKVDYIGISPIFNTSTKKSDLAPSLGIEGLKMIRPLFSKPIVCIGGIQKKNVADIIKNGANGVAVISAISKAEYPEEETKNLKEIICQTGLIP
ncbi:thiamine phosphate synthase [Patiriisocius sp. Uisw_017]|jgi:thiamine-phosphate pyrophosphorylase|uniref:thiamine phosphate synthase n=1 Tax=Patiriisocius sp. Uisw_017 TaxID=3230968 RepID=UPI0039ED3BE5